MNANRLRHVIDLLFAANKKHNIPALVQTVQNTYTQSVQNPEPGHATEFDAAINALRNVGNEFPIGSLSPSRRNILFSIGGAGFYGEQLVQRVEKIIREGQTPSNAVAELQEFAQSCQAFFENVGSMRGGFDKLNIEQEGLTDTTAEIEIILPSAITSQNISGFSKQLKRIDRAVSDIREVATGNREPLDIRSVGSGSIEIFVTVDLVTGAAVLTFVTAVVQLINALLDTRKDRKSLEDKSAPQKILDQIRAWEQERIDEELDKLRTELLAAYQGADERKNELNNSLSTSLKLLADAIDRGVDIDVTTAAVTKGEEDAEDESPDVKAARLARNGQIERIQESANSILQLERTDDTILHLDVQDPDDID